MAVPVPRHLVRMLGRAETAPVTIIEGARAVGKTTALRGSQKGELAAFTYVTLEDRAQFAEAANDPYGWLGRQPLPLIIDEAQLIPDLLREVKRKVDLQGASAHIILTGSSTLSGDSLGGRNPLAGRSQTYTMWPLTTWELNRQSGSIVDALFEGEPARGALVPLTDSELVDDFRRGGFPLNRFSDTPLVGPRLDARVENDLRSRLADRVDPTLDFDVTAARGALDHLLCAPGAIFNAQRLSQQLELDARTARRYLDVFHRLFLVASLRNLASAPARQAYQRLKVYPIDTAFVVDALRRSGRGPLERREDFGALLETYVVTQALAAAQWSRARPDAFYWRNARQDEVDLVMRDGKGRLVGVEVKAASSVGLQDARGLAALDRDRPLHRGFIVYRGTEVKQLSEKFWALPTEALGSAAAFGGMWNQDPPEPTTTELWRDVARRAEGTPLNKNSTASDATVFLSYVHADDQNSRGRIVQFVKDVVDTYGLLTGNALELFVDRDDILWGQKWKQRLDSQIDRTAFLLPVITPRYLRSDACREELLRFAALQDDNPQSRQILPLIWVDTADSDVVDSDPVRTRLSDHQHVDVSGLRLASPESPEYRARVEEVASRLAAAVHAREVLAGSIALSQGSSPTNEEPDDDLLDALEEFQGGQASLEAAMIEFGRAFDDLGRAFDAVPPPASSSPQLMQVALANAGRALASPVRDLTVATEALASSWEALARPARRLVSLYRLQPSGEGRLDLRESLAESAQSISAPEMAEMREQARLMGSFSKHLRPLSRALDGAFRTIETIHSSMIEMRDQMSV
jgi:predicted AAA+ superfamily ATPase